jgi:uncharacterized protein (TIGR03437 family)
VTHVLNAASFQPGIAPGAYATIQGTNLAASAVSPASGIFGNTLGGVSVTLNGTAVPLLYISPTQINFQVPFSIAPGKAYLVVTAPAGKSDATAVDIAAAAPGIFQDSAGHALALNQDFSVNTSAHQVRAGDIILLYLTGGGLLMTSLPNGGVSPGTPVSLVLPAVVTVGGQSADVLFAGAAPLLSTGLVQINARVPSGLATGDYPVKVTIGGQVSSNTPVISVVGR